MVDATLTEHGVRIEDTFLKCSAVARAVRRKSSWSEEVCKIKVACCPGKLQAYFIKTVVETELKCRVKRELG